tara:strand:- start:351 stop:1016 length:666 start_codon:yes stop_codon:yes gene_type:complete
MNISPETLTILKNFSNINSSLVVKQGNILRTISPAKNILAKFECPESFQNDFAVYDLNEFLGSLSLFKDPDFDFSDTSYLHITNDKFKFKYFFSDPSVITAPPEKDIELPSVDVEFTLTEEVLSSVLRAASISQLPDLSLVGEKGNINLVVRTKNNDTSNQASLEVGKTSSEFCFNFKVENLKILPGVYTVQVSTANISKFTHDKWNLSYLIALEPDSTFN